MNSLRLIATETFNGLPCDVYNHGNQIFMTRKQIGEALGYENPMVAIAKLHGRHKDRLDKFSALPNLGNDGKIRTAYLYSQRGIFEICHWSRQPKADEFMDWVWDIGEKYRGGGLVRRQEPQKLYTINSHLQSQILSITKEAAREAATEAVKEAVEMIAEKKAEETIRGIFGKFMVGFRNE